MNSNTMMQRCLLPGLVSGVLVLATTSATAVTFDLAAKQFDIMMPDGVVTTMWGFVEDTDGCFASTPESARLTCVQGLPDPTLAGGPRLSVPAGDTTLAIRLSNGLPVPTSIVIPGQEMPVSSIGNGPTWDNGSVGSRPNATARVRSFGREAAAGGGSIEFLWDNAGGNEFQPGTYLYHSGTHPQVQVQMGLYGAISSDTGASQAYGIGYDATVDLFFSEIDPALHTAVAGGSFSGSTLDYNPKYFLINGAPFAAGTSSCISGFSQGDDILLRLYNAGLRELAPMLLGAHFDLVAEGGKAYPYARRQYQTLLMPGSTKDAVFTPGYNTTYALLDRRLNLTNDAASGGGFQTCLAVGPDGPNNPPTADANGPYNGTAGIAVSFNGSGSGDPDGDPLTYTWDFGDGNGGTGITPTHSYAADGLFSVTLTVDDGNNSPVVSPATTATIAVNQAPTADANGPYSGKTGVPIDFDGGGSSDPEGQPLGYSWDFGDGNSGTGITPMHTYTTAGEFAVELTVNDGFQDSALVATTATVTDNTDPVAALSAPATSVSATVTIDGCGSSDDDDDALTYDWNFGDGATDTTTDPDCSVMHIFPTLSGNQTYTVTLTVNDGFGGSNMTTTDITIFGVAGNDAPVANPDAFNPNEVYTGNTGTATVAAPGVLANDTDDGNIVPLIAVVVAGSANEQLFNLALNTDGSFTYNPGEKVGVFPFSYTAFDGEVSSAPTQVAVTREIWVDVVEYRASNNRWNIKGKSAQTGGTVTIYLGPATGGTVLTTANVAGNTNWSINTTALASPGGATTISVDVVSTAGGAVLNVPITFK